MSKCPGGFCEMCSDDVWLKCVSDIKIETKICNKCDRVLPLAEFYTRGDRMSRRKIYSIMKCPLCKKKMRVDPNTKKVFCENMNCPWWRK